MNGRRDRDRDRVRTDPPSYPPRHLDHGRDPWQEVQEQADRSTAEAVVRAIYEGN